MTLTDIEVRYLEPREYPVLTAFYRRWLPNGERVAAMFEWRADHPDESGGNAPLGAFAGTTLVGTVNTNPAAMHGMDRHQDATWYADTIVAPEARGRGVARSLVVRATEGPPLLLAKGSNRKMYALRTGVGFVDVPNDGYLILPLTARSESENRSLRLAAPVLLAASKLRRRRARSGSMELRTIRSFGGGYDALLDRMRAEPYLTPVKRSAYLNWRYADHPLRTYHVIEAADGAGLRGAVVLRAPGADEAQAWVVDVLAPLTDGDAVDTLLEAARGWAVEQGAESMRTFATSVHARRRLRRAGFLPTGSTPHFTYYVRSAPAEILPPAADWNTWHGDSDNEVY